MRNRIKLAATEENTTPILVDPCSAAYRFKNIKKIASVSVGHTREGKGGMPNQKKPTRLGLKRTFSFSYIRENFAKIYFRFSRKKSYENIRYENKENFRENCCESDNF
jgi:hypothetical protein